jgi:hypothetical protein
VASEDDDAGTAVERFPPTNGRVMGVVGLAVVALILVLSIVASGSGIAPGIVTGSVFAAVLIWAVMLRPAVRVEAGDLVLRGAVDTRRVPLASIDGVVVATVLVVTVDGSRYTNTSLGRSARQSLKDHGKDLIDDRSYAAVAESRITRLVEDARALGGAPGAVRREWAWPEIAGLVVSGLATLVLSVL